MQKRPTATESHDDFQSELFWPAHLPGAECVHLPGVSRTMGTPAPDSARGSGPTPPNPPASSATIKPIARDAVHRICSGQVVLDLAGAVKELVENSLDAGATNVEVRLKDHGADTIEVADNGSGVAPENHEKLTVKYATSKIENFEDLESLRSFGFRGEALSSLCALSESFTVTTRTADEDAGHKITYDRFGLIVDSKTAPRAVGTTITVKGLFKPVAVRHKEFSKNVKREYGKLLSLLQAYALVSVDTRLIVSHQSGQGANSRRTTVLHTQGSSVGGGGGGGGSNTAGDSSATDSLLANIINVFGAKVSQGLLPIDCIPLPGYLGCILQGFVSKPSPGTGRSSGDRQFFYVNGRPVDLPKMSKTLNELYRNFVVGTSNNCPFALLDFKLPPDAYDVNVTPDKRKVLLHDEQALLKTARQVVEEMYAPSRYTYGEGQGADVGGVDNSVKQDCDETRAALPAPGDDELMTQDPSTTAVVKHEPGSQPSPAFDFASFGLGNAGSSAAPQRTSGNPSRSRQGNLERAGFTVEKSRVALGDGWRAPVSDERLNMGPSLRDEDDDGDDPNDEEYVPEGEALHEDENENENENENTKRLARASRLVEPSSAQFESVPSHFGTEPAGTPNDVRENTDTQETPQDLPYEQSPSSGMVKLEVETVDAPSIHQTQSTPGGSLIVFSMSTLQSKRTNLIRARRAKRHAREVLATQRAAEKVKAASAFESASLARPRGIENLLDDDADATEMPRPSNTTDPLGPALGDGDTAATNTLERVFRKQDFTKMTVVGQFNLGFILCTLGSDLFIVDQHASDEIFNFEKLQHTTVLNKQPLIVPAKLDLTAAEEQTVRQHMDVFLANGFGFCEDAEKGLVGRDGEVMDNDTNSYECVDGCCLALKSVPFSKGVTFGVSDVQELIGMLDDGVYAAPARTQLSVGLSQAPGGGGGGGGSKEKNSTPDNTVLRPSRVRAMLAMRACRSSIMIGKALDLRRMKGILNNLSTLKAPWNCPHGRPTMRHLADLRKLNDEVNGSMGKQSGGKRKAGGW